MLYIIHYDYSVTNEMMKSLLVSYDSIKTIKLNLLNRKLNFIQRILLKLSKLTKSSFGYNLLYTNKELATIKNITKYDQILFWDYIVDYNELKHLISLTKVSYSSISLWVWNTLDKYSIKTILKLKKHNINIYTFDKIDSKKYDIKLLNQVHYRKVSLDNKYVYDFLFVGTDKGRCEKLNDLYKALTEKKYNCRFIIVKDKNKDYSKYQNIEIIENNLPYDYILKLISKSKVIVDITKPNQYGITLRVLESVFYSKKLLTNNKTIIGLDIYSNSNMLIMDEQNDFLKDIHTFLNKSVIPYNNNLIEKYCIENWIKHFL